MERNPPARTAGSPAAVPVNHTRHQFLAGAGLAFNHTVASVGATRDTIL